jgi:hypothetical protein
MLAERQAERGVGAYQSSRKKIPYVNSGEEIPSINKLLLRV